MFWKLNMLRKINLLLITILMFGAASSLFAQGITVNAGNWDAYATDGTLQNTNYKIKIFKNADYISVSFAGNGGHYAMIAGNQIRLTNYDPVGTISADGNRIDWNNRTYWVRQGAPMSNTLNSGNMNGTYRLKKNDGTLVAGMPSLEITQNGANVFFTANNKRFQTQIIDDSVFLGEMMAVIEQNGNILRTRGGYFQRDGYTGPVGAGTGVPRLQAQCNEMLQGKVALDRNGNTNWVGGQLERLCTGTSNPQETVTCFKNVLNRLGDTDKATQSCSFLAKWIAQYGNPSAPPASTVSNLSGDWVGYYPNGSKSPYIWRIMQSASNLNFQDMGGTGTKFTGRLENGRITDSNNKTATLSADGTRITWSDGVVYLKQTVAAAAPKPTPKPIPQLAQASPSTSQNTTTTQPIRPPTTTASPTPKPSTSINLNGVWRIRSADGAEGGTRIEIKQSGTEFKVDLDGTVLKGVIDGKKFIIVEFGEPAAIESATSLKWKNGDRWVKVQ